MRCRTELEHARVVHTTDEHPFTAGPAHRSVTRHAPWGRKSQAALDAVSVGRRLGAAAPKSHGWPPRRTSRSTPTCCVTSARSSGRTSSSTGEIKNRPRQARLRVLAGYQRTAPSIGPRRGRSGRHTQPRSGAAAASISKRRRPRSATAPHPPPGGGRASTRPPRGLPLPPCRRTRPPDALHSAAFDILITRPLLLLTAGRATPCVPRRRRAPETPPPRRALSVMRPVGLCVIAVKLDYGLSVDAKERDALEGLLGRVGRRFLGLQVCSLSCSYWFRRGKP